MTAASKATQETINNDPGRATLEGRVRELESEKSRLEKDLDAAKDESDLLLEAAEEERDREHTARTDAEDRAEQLERERSRLENNLTATRDERDRERAARIADTKAEPERGGNGRLSSAWRLFSKAEPTYAFVDAMCVLESDLHELVGGSQWPRPELEGMLKDAYGLSLIDEKQQERLHGMRRKRNRILHENQRLRGPQTREDLVYLEQVMGKLDS